MASVKDSILKTLIYSDIFSFPLSRGELWEYLVSDKKITQNEFNQGLLELINKKMIVYEKGFYAFSTKRSNIDRRLFNLPEVSQKINIAQKTVKVISCIPTIKLIGLSGGLAMYDADSEDDIDLFVVASKKTVFVTRFWILFALQIMGLRRTRFDKNPADKICVNMVIDEESLSWSQADRDIYTAHEIVQLKPLFERDCTYSRFVSKNKWINKFFPNFSIEKTDKSIYITGRDNLLFRMTGAIFGCSFFEFILRKFQESLIQRNKTREKVDIGVLALHPVDYRADTLYKLRLKFLELGLLTKL